MSSGKWLTFKALALSAGVAWAGVAAFADSATVTLAHSPKSEMARQAAHGTTATPKHEMKDQKRAKMASTPKREEASQTTAKTSGAASREGMRQSKAPHGYDSVQLFPGEL